MKENTAIRGIILSTVVVAFGLVMIGLYMYIDSIIQGFFIS
jgi:hypothetical protein